MDLRRARRRLFVLSLLWWRRAWFSFRRGPGGECGAAEGKDDFREGQESKPDGFRRELIGGGFFFWPLFPASSGGRELTEVRIFLEISTPITTFSQVRIICPLLLEGGFFW